MVRVWTSNGRQQHFRKRPITRVYIVGICRKLLTLAVLPQWVFATEQIQIRYILVPHIYNLPWEHWFFFVRTLLPRIMFTTFQIPKHSPSPLCPLVLVLLNHIPLGVLSKLRYSDSSGTISGVFSILFLQSQKQRSLCRCFSSAGFRVWWFQTLWQASFTIVSSCCGRFVSICPSDAPPLDQS